MLNGQTEILPVSNNPFPAIKDNKMQGTLIVDQSKYNYLEDLCSTPHSDIEKDKVIYDNEYQFPNHYRMVVQVVSPLSPAEESCWTQGVLFDENGNELGSTDVGESFGGEYCVSYEGEDYLVMVKSESEPKKFAHVSWCVGDVLALRPEWNEEQAEEWLLNNEKYIQEGMVERGWNVMENLLPSEEEEE
jgi:hypothetical protein